MKDNNLKLEIIMYTKTASNQGALGKISAD